MSLQPTLALLALPAMLYAAYWALRRDHSRLALSLVLTLPIVMGGVYLLAGRALQPANLATTPPPSTPSSAVEDASSAASTPSSTVNAAGSKVAELRRQAEEARRTKNYAEATARFREVTQVAPFDPDGWADLGDAQAAAAGGNLEAGRAAIDRALEIDAEHSKALWLKASLELQAKRYAAAADLWRRLLKSLPADSSDAKIVQTNLDETERLAGANGAKR